MPFKISFQGTFDCNSRAAVRSALLKIKEEIKWFICDKTILVLIFHKEILIYNLLSAEFCFVDSVNRESLNLIETCIFVICLDDSIPLSFNHQTSIDETNMGYRDDVSLATQMLHGFGTKVNSCNRWFDKTMQVSPILCVHTEICYICQIVWCHISLFKF